MGLLASTSADGRLTQNLSIFDPASPPAEQIRQLFILVLTVAAVIFLIVEGVLLYSLWRFRSKEAAATEPPQVYGSMPIEIAWTAAPTLIVFLLVLVLARTTYEVRVSPAQPLEEGSQPLFVTVIGHQWWWEYFYEKYDSAELNFIAANELHVPVSDARVPRPIYLTLKSADVCHSFWVPRLAGKTDLIPGKPNQMWFQTDKTGLFLGQCAEYCGTQHANMLLRVVVDEPATFHQWCQDQMRDAAGDPKEDQRVTDGRKEFLSQSCINCHRVRGTPAKGTYAPDLTHLMSRQTLASGMVANTPEMLRDWVRDPQKIKEGCLMPAFGLSKEKVEQIVDYLSSLR